MRIVAIDDQPRDLKSLVGALQGFRPPGEDRVTVSGFLDYTKAINYLSRETVDAVVCDMVMGEHRKEGLEVIRLLANRSAIVIVLTGYPDIPNCVEAIREGAWDYLEKNPADRSDPYDRLLGSLEKACDARLKRPERGVSNPDMEWVNQNLSRLIRKYPGKVVAVLYQRVVDVDKSVGTLTQRVRTAFPFARPTVISIPEKRLEEII